MWKLHEPWRSLFPRRAAVEFWLLKNELRRMNQVRPQQRGSIARTKCRELTETVRCHTELPLWEFRAAEDEEDVLADAEEQFGVTAATWEELRGSPRLHPTMKPVGLVAATLRNSTRRGDLVLDSFLGSGTTLIAAEWLGRACLGVDCDERYAQVAIERWQRLTGHRATFVRSFEPCDS